MHELEIKILSFFNQSIANQVFDLFFPFWTDVQQSVFFYALMILLVGFLVVKKNWKSITVLGFCLLGMFIVGRVNSDLLKPAFNRARPSQTILRTNIQKSPSMPSGHALSAFFMAMFLSLFFPKLSLPLFLMAGLTGFSRMYNGVHYLGDVMVGAVLGLFFAYLYYLLVDQLMKKKMKFLATILVIVVSLPAFAERQEWKDPTRGKPLFPWIWEDQIRPVVITGFDKTGLQIFAAAAGATFITHQYDGKIYDFSDDGGNLWMSEKTAKKFGKLGNGLVGIGIAATQLYFDQDNGLRTARAVIFTSVSHMTSAAIIRRRRPNNRSDFLPFPSSFPSGHTSSAFAVAGSMAYSYGWAGALPGYAVASAIALSRVKENRHWASDIIGGAFMGTFWARASFRTKEYGAEEIMYIPSPVEDGMMITAMKSF
jgi:membrane-associated phospholipid phosphatase